MQEGSVGLMRRYFVLPVHTDVEGGAKEQVQRCRPQACPSYCRWKWSWSVICRVDMIWSKAEGEVEEQQVSGIERGGDDSSAVRSLSSPTS